MIKYLLAAALTVTPLVANAQQQCVSLQQANELLGTQFGESATLLAVSEDAAYFFYANDETQTWTIVALQTNGCAELVDEGTGWEFLPGFPLGEEM